MNTLHSASSLWVGFFLWPVLHSVMLDVTRVSNNIITDLRSPIYVPLCLNLISPNDDIKGYDVQSRKPKLLTFWTWKYYISKIIASSTYLTSYTADTNGRWHANISQHSGNINIIIQGMYFVRWWNLNITWHNSCQYFTRTLVTLEKTSLWGEMMNGIFQYLWHVKSLSLPSLSWQWKNEFRHWSYWTLNIDWQHLLLLSSFLDRKHVQNEPIMTISWYGQSWCGREVWPPCVFCWLHLEWLQTLWWEIAINVIE